MKFMIRLRFLASAALAFVFWTHLSGPLIGQAGLRDSLEKLDRNQNGYIEPDEVTPDYKNHGGWQEDLTDATTEAALPESLTNYIAMVEKEMATPISIVSVGPDRAQTIER